MISTPTDLFFRGCGLLLALFVAVACAQAQPAPGDRPSAVRTSYREMPVRLCVPVQAETWPALQSGKTRLILHIQNQTPAVVYSRPFHIALLGPDKAKPVPIDDLAMQPDVQPSGHPEPQHFGINLKGHLPAAPSSTLCIEVSVDKENAAEGNAEHPLRIWATLEPLGSPPAAGKP